MKKLSLILPSILTLFFITTLLSVFSIAELPAVKDTPVELGQVDWIRNFDEATAKAKQQNKPMLVLFQEVPGCNTSSGYGKNVFSSTNCRGNRDPICTCRHIP